MGVPSQSIVMFHSFLVCLPEDYRKFMEYLSSESSGEWRERELRSELGVSESSLEIFPIQGGELVGATY